MLSTTTAATCGVAEISPVGVNTGTTVDVSVITTNGPGKVGVGVTEGARTVTEVADGKVTGAPPSGVGVGYCPHRDALPTQDAVIKETAINKAESRLTLNPFRELYL